MHKNQGQHTIEAIVLFFQKTAEKISLYLKVKIIVVKKVSLKIGAKVRQLRVMVII